MFNVNKLLIDLKGNALLSSLGGALSLYLGMAVVLLFEVLELILDLAINTWRYLNGGITTGKKSRSLK